MRLLRHALALVTIWSATACATFPKQAFDKRANAGLRTIAILEAPAPETLVVSNVGGVASGFGLLGAAIEESEEARKSRLFNQAVLRQRETLGQRLNDALASALRQAGYQVSLVSHRYLVARDDAEAPDYSDVDTDAEALLDAHYERAGYVALGSDYLPWFLISARLIRVRGQQRLYAKQLSYGAAIRERDVEHFPSDPKYRYASFDSLSEHAEEAAQGLAAGIPLVASRIAGDLR